MVFDCADPEALGAFWASALHYTERPPPDGYASWAEYDAAHNVPAEEAGYMLVDPDGVGPTVFFQKVPEQKVAKNRLHIDIRASLDSADPEKARQRIETSADELIAVGATFLWRSTRQDDYFVTLADPEGNEFCVV